MKKLSFLMIFCMIVCSFACVSAEADGSEWARAVLEKAAYANIAPDDAYAEYAQEITRSEFCELVVNTYRALGKVIPAEVAEPFDDVNLYSVSAAYSIGVVNGVSETEFAPNEPVTREQMAVMMGRLARTIDVESVSADLNVFDDCGLVADWALDDMKFMVGAGIVQGDEENRLLPKANAEREQAIVMMWRLYRYLGGEDVKLFEETTVDILTELNIMDKEKLDSNEHISVYDFFVILEKANNGSSVKYGNLSEWYIGDALAKLDHIEDSKKELLLNLCYSGRNQILDYSEIAELQLDNEITNAEALLYILRMVWDTYSCTDSVLDYLKNIDDVKLYKAAYAKGLIDSENADRADNAITYKELGEILHKAIFTGYYSGGYAGSYKVRLYDCLADAMTVEESSKTDTSVKRETVEISVDAKWKDDLSAEWSLPEEYSFIADGKYLTDVDLITKSGECKGYIISGSVRTGFGSDEIVELLVRYADDPVVTIRCTYRLPGEDTEYSFDTDLPDIKIDMSDEAIKPGKYVCRPNSWCAKEITLGEAQEFEEGCYYVLKGYEKRYRKDEYNSVFYECFKAESSSDAFVGPNVRGGSFGVIYTDEIRIRKVEMDGNATDGFVLVISPESSEIFEVVKK